MKVETEMGLLLDILISAGTMKSEEILGPLNRHLLLPVGSDHFNEHLAMVWFSSLQ